MSEHSHSHASGNERKIAIAAILTGSFMFAEVVGGILSRSLALIADAGHMLTDFASLLLAWIAFRLARRPADSARTYGYDRVSVLAAFLNGLSLFAIAIWIAYEAYHRLSEPVEVLGGLMLAVALGGLLINITSFLVLTRGESDNLNVRAAALHVMGDLLGSVAALVASLVIIFTGWTPIDPILSVFVTLLILRSAYRVIRESTHILLEGSPSGFDPDEVAKALVAGIDGVEAITHVHAWSLTQERPMITLEARVVADASPAQITDNIRALLRDQFNYDHAVIEVTSR